MHRSEQSRKYAFGVLGVYGDEPNLEIKGVWMWKGTELLEPLLENMSFEYYSKRKLDLSKPEDKDVIV